MTVLRVALCLLGTSAMASRVDAAPVPLAAKPKTPEPVPVEIAEVWREAGFEVGWMGADTDWYFRPGKAGQPGEIPAFHPSRGPFSFRELPTPDRAFGLDLTDSDPSAADLTSLAEFKRLHALRLSGTKITDESLNRLAAVTGLRALALKSCWEITNTGLKHLGSLTELLFLELGYCAVTDDGLKHLAALKQLCALSISGTNVTDAGLKHLVGLTQLQRLDLWETNVRTGEELPRFPNLRALSLNSRLVTDKTMAVVGTLSLRRLDIRGADISTAGWRHLIALTDLRRLSADPSNDSELELIGRFTKLEELRCRSDSITDAGLKNLAGLTELRVFGLQSTSITGSGLAHLAPWRKLESLDLSHVSKLVDSELRYLVLFKNLREVALSFTSITDKGLKRLTGLTELRALYLTGTKVTSEGVKHLTRLTELRRLWLGRTNVTNDGLKHFAQMRKLEELSLWGTSITDDGIDDLVALKTLTILDLSRTAVTAAGWNKLERALPICAISR